MTTLTVVRANWTGMIGGPGVSTFYFAAPTAVPLPDVRTFLNSMAPNIASTVKIQIPNAGLTIDSTTGQPNGSWTAPVVTDIQCTGAGAYSAAVGAVVNWLTGVYVNGRQLRGRTFLVPMSAQVYGSDGRITPALQTSLKSAAATFLSTSNPPVVYSRSTKTYAAAATASVPLTTAVLRSRRD